MLTSNAGDSWKSPSDPGTAEGEDHDGHPGGEGVHGQAQDSTVDSKAGRGGDAPCSDGRCEEGVGDPPPVLRGRSMQGQIR